MVLPERYENWKISLKLAVFCGLLTLLSLVVSVDCVGKCVVETGQSEVTEALKSLIFSSLGFKRPCIVLRGVPRQAC